MTTNGTIPSVGTSNGVRRLICLSCTYSSAAGTPPTVTAVPHNCLTSQPPAPAVQLVSAPRLSVDGDFDARLERPRDVRLVRDDAIEVDAWHFLGGRRTEDEHRKKNRTWHSET
jgi:hypothetical protein